MRSIHILVPFLLLALAAPAAQAEESAPEGASKAKAVEALALAAARAAAWEKRVSDLDSDVRDAKDDVRSLRVAPARGRSEAKRRENERKLDAAETHLEALQSKQRALGEAADGVDIESLTAKLAGAVDAGAPVDQKDKDGYTALHLASWFGSTDVARALLAAGADANLTAPQSPLSGDPLGASKQSNCPLSGPTPLHLASYAGRGAIVELLLEHGAKPNAVLGFKDTGAG